MLFLLRNLSYIILIITGDNAGVKQKGDKNDIKNTSHSINKKSRRQNVYDLENTLCCDYEIDELFKRLCYK